jgi:hypothetical protein
MDARVKPAHDGVVIPAARPCAGRGKDGEIFRALDWKPIPQVRYPERGIELAQMIHRPS